METLSTAELESIAALVADRSLSSNERESRATALAGSPDLARRALEWLPEAFGLIALQHLGVGLPTTFSARSLEGTWHQFPFSAEPLFALSVQLASSQSDEFFKAIAEQSSSINAVDKALNAGHSLEGAKIAGPALIGIPAETYLTGYDFGITEIEA